MDVASMRISHAHLDEILTPLVNRRTPRSNLNLPTSISIINPEAEENLSLEMLSLHVTLLINISILEKAGGLTPKSQEISTIKVEAIQILDHTPSSFKPRPLLLLVRL